MACLPAHITILSGVFRSDSNDDQSKKHLLCISCCAALANHHLPLDIMTQNVPLCHRSLPKNHCQYHANGPDVIPATNNSERMPPQASMTFLRCRPLHCSHRQFAAYCFQPVRPRRLLSDPRTRPLPHGCLSKNSFDKAELFIIFKSCTQLQHSRLDANFV